MADNSLSFLFVIVFVYKYHNFFCLFVFSGCSNDHNFVTKTVDVGQNVTLSCIRQSTLLHQETLFWIRLVSGNQFEFLGGTFTFDYDDVNNTSHITVKQEPGTFIMQISKTKLSDTGFYYCIKVRQLAMTFLEGTFLTIKGKKKKVYVLMSLILKCSVQWHLNKVHLFIYVNLFQKDQNLMSYKYDLLIVFIQEPKRLCSVQSSLSMRRKRVQKIPVCTGSELDQRNPIPFMFMETVVMNVGVLKLPHNVNVSTASQGTSAPLILGLTTVLWPYVDRSFLEMNQNWTLKVNFTLLHNIPM